MKVLRSLALLFAACISTTALAADQGSPLFDVPRLDNIRIDGDANDWGDRGMRVDVLAGEDGAMKEPNDLDASFRLGWNDAGLLVLVKVRDNEFIESPNDAELWRSDCVELYLGTGRGEKELYQIVVSPGMDPNHADLRWFAHDHRKDANLKKTTIEVAAARAATKGGYTLEVLLPWEPLGIKPAAGREVGFQMFVADQDANSKQFHAIWYPRVGTFQNTTSMHRLMLSDKASPPVQAAARVTYESTRQLRVRVIGVPALVGKGVEIKIGDANIAIDKFAKKDGRAYAAITMPLLTREQAQAGSPQVVSEGKVVATIDQRIMSPPAPAENESLFGSRIQRTMSLLATSNPSRRTPVKILFYGQSITAGPWAKMLEGELRERFPYADMTVENRAIGGFEAFSLVRTSEADLYPAYADLVIFHVYGGEYTGELERIISNIRRYTTSEIMLATHHAPLMDAAYHTNAQFDYSADATRLLAQKYNCELVEVREEWRQYVKENHLDPKSLLADDVHPNAEGNQLMAVLIGRHFKFNTTTPGGWFDMVRTYEAKRLVDEGAADEVVFTGAPWVLPQPKNNSERSHNCVFGSDPNSAMKLRFTGNRVDVTAGMIEGKLGTARLLIDGKSPSQNPMLYVFSHTSSAPQTWFPGLRRVGRQKPLVLEDWKLKVTEMAEDGKKFSFDVEGSVTGPDGSGSSDELFVSKSGRVVIEPRDHVILDALKIFKVACPPNFEVRWRVLAMFADTFAPESMPDTKDRAKMTEYQTRVQRVTVAQGLTNAEHTLEIVPNGDGPVPVEEITVYRPPLR